MCGWALVRTDSPAEEDGFELPVPPKTREPDTTPPGEVAIEAPRLMEDGRYRHLSIVDDGRVVGIVSRFDFRGMELDRLDEEAGLWERI